MIRTLKFAVSIFCLAGPLLASPVQAACTTPHVLTNGQIANATDVMENFDAVAACADEAVKPSGTPSTGSVAVFSSSKSVTSGNLSGDVTTSGGTVATLAPSGVTAGTYTSATIAVDAKGRVIAAANGSGGGSSAFVLIDTKIADGTSGTLVFTSIPQVYRDLVVVVTGQSASAVQDLYVYANGDTTNANYRNWTWNQWGSNSISAPRVAVFPGAGIPNANSAAQIEATFYNYTSTTWKKNAIANSQYEDSSNFFRNVMEWKWNSTSAITQLSFQVQSGNFSTGTIISLYGRGLN